MDYQVLQGEHEEQLILDVSASGPIDASTPVPLIQPSVERGDYSSSAFVMHSQVADESDRALSEQLPDITKLRDVDPKECLRLMRIFRQRFVGATAAKLTEKKPLRVVKAAYDPVRKTIGVLLKEEKSH